MVLALKGLKFCLYYGQISDSSKLKEFVNDNLIVDENCSEFSIRVVNTVGKGEIARYERFLLFQRCFQKTSAADSLKTRACLGNG